MWFFEVKTLSFVHRYLLKYGYIYIYMYRQCRGNWHDAKTKPAYLYNMYNEKINFQPFRGGKLSIVNYNINDVFGEGRALDVTKTCATGKLRKTIGRLSQPWLVPSFILFYITILTLLFGWIWVYDYNEIHNFGGLDAQDQTIVYTRL